LWEDDRKELNMNSDSPETPSISCTLASPELQARLEWISRLNAQALREHHRNDLRIELIYASDAVESVREMVERERLCCAFLNISIQEEQDFVTVMLEVPEEGRAVAPTVFESFLAGARNTPKP
jgi:hypothetical protein